MFYVGIEIAYYKQLTVINPDLMHFIEEKLANVYQQNDIRLVKKKGGLLILKLPFDQEADPLEVLEMVWHLEGVLKEKQQDLFGYNLFVLLASTKNDTEIEATITKNLFLLEVVAGIWLHRKDRDFFANVAQLKEEEDFLQVLAIRRSEPVYSTILYIAQIREQLNTRLAQALLKWLGHKKTRLLIIYGPPDTARLELVFAALTSVLGKERLKYLQFIDSRETRLPVWGPLFASILATRDLVLKNVGRYLAPWERAVWRAHESLFKAMLEGRYFPGDRLKDDFFISYQLYLLAYARLMESCHLPMLLVFHEPEHLSPFIRQRLGQLIDELAKNKRVAIVIVCSDPRRTGLCKGWGRFKLKLRPLGVREIAACFKALYPGIHVPRRVIKTVFRLSAGRLSSILHYIYYLRLQKKIVQEEKNFVWVPACKLKIKIPTNPLWAAALLIRSLKEEARTILTSYYLLGRLFSRQEFLAFLKQLGLDPRRVEEQLAYLQNMHFISEDAIRLKGRSLLAFLKKIAPTKFKYLEEQAVIFLTTHMEQFLPQRALKVYRLLAYYQAHDVILKTLPGVLDYFIETGSFKKIQAFFEPQLLASRFKFSSKQLNEIAYYFLTAQLRLSLGAANLAEATELVKKNQMTLETLVPDPVFACLYLELGRFYLASQDPDKALPLFKKAMYFYQELNIGPQTGEAFLELGRCFLAKGNWKEALQYFEFARKMFKDKIEPRLAMRTLWNEAAANYLEGNYSRLLACCDEAALLAEGQGLRQSGLLFTFIKARTMFDLGFYEKAIRLCEEGLCQIEVYRLNQARTCFLAWLARATAYLGQVNLAIAILRSLPETQESLFFLGEAYFLNRDVKKAEKTFVKALHLKEEAVFLFADCPLWQTGFALLEGLCLTLNEHGSPLKRMIRTYRAYLLCQGNELAQGVAELHSITITEKLSSTDPHSHLLNFFYYLVLKNIDKNQTSFPEIGHALTILNKALKSLQERSARIDEPRDRINYVTQNYWNKYILEEGKLNKLI